MTSEWKTVKLGELGRIVTGKTPPTIDQDNFGNEYPFITPKDMNGLKFIRQTERYLSEKGKNFVKNCVIPAKSICVSCIGSDLGKVVMTKTESVTNQQLNSIICKEKIDRNFVYYSLVNISPQFKNIGHNSTAVPIINKTDFSNFEIDLPPLSTQQKIAEILSSLDDKIELNRQMNATLEAMAQTLFKEWFVKPTTEGVVEKTSLDEYIDFSPKLNIKVGKEVSYIEMGDLPTSGFSISNKVKRPFTSGSKFQNYDTLFARITPCLENGKTGFVDLLEENEIAFGSTEFIIMRAKEGISPYFVYFIARDENFKQFAISNMIGSSGRQRVPASILRTYEINKINSSSMEQFNELIKPFFEKIRQYTLEIQTLKQLRDSLLPKLLRGEIII